MDPKVLLEDLHFQLSNAGSGHAPILNVDSLNRLSLEKLQLEEEDRTKMTEKWVAHVRLQNRQRCLSSDSYFGTVSICDKLKKSFLKPFAVTEEEMENLRLRLARIKLEDKNSDSIRDQKCLDLNKFDVGEGINLPVPESIFRPPIRRVRSKTVPLLHFLNNPVSDNSLESTRLVEHPNFSCNLASMQSVDLIKDILFDENRNLITREVFPCHLDSCIKSPETVEIEKVHTFRDENLFPCSSELKGKREKSKASPNRIVGCYQNEEDYLRTQFYLLREDFIIPLLEGIAEYKAKFKEGIIPSDVKNLKLHHDVYVREPRFTENKLGIAIDMGCPLSEKIKEKDFMEGSLVLLTPNHFEDIYIGTVLSRRCLQPNLGNRRKGKGKPNILIVQLHATSHFLPSLSNCKVLLAESQAFFQPYYYVMKIFQGMTDDDLPFKQYILGSQTKGLVEAPTYLLKNTEYVLEECVKVNVLNGHWPSAEMLKVNESQLIALKKALSCELVLIQGPPGTGKTYLGCQVAKALLQNRKVWNTAGNQPMLLMCQTNHALDQFMELLLPVCQNIMRIGCQSKSDKLGRYNIRSWLKRGQRRRMHPELENCLRELKEVESKIKAFNFELMRIASHGVVDLKTLLSMRVLESKHKSCFISSQNFVMWLEEARYCPTHLSSTKKSEMEMICFEHSCAKTQGYNRVENSDVMKPEEYGNNLEFDLIKDMGIEYIVSLPVEEQVYSLKKSGKPNNQAAGQLKLIEENEERFTFFLNRIVGKVESGSSQCTDVGQCLWTLDTRHRWALYRSWIKKLEGTILSLLEYLETQYLSVSSTLADLQQHEKLYAMRQVALVGMTTSAAARLYPVLRELRCPIAIVEEAAEVHESHIVATVTQHCKHLILLGDHKQLRPRPASYSLSKTHFTDVSLFERLLLNNTLTVNTLLTQHRMQPEISALIRPSIYAELYDHESTKNRENIHGIKKNVFFWSHFSQEHRNLMSGSYSNPEEANMAVQLSRYLVSQEYTVNEICILSAYREQVTQIEENCKLYSELDGMRVLTVDNFQGEESKIVILSLVRNNYQTKIGFLQIENRVCVALSRARDGLFMLGNIELLSYCSELWSSVHKLLKKSDSVGSSLPLSCRQHPQKQKLVHCSTDLLLYLQSGGCQDLCLYKLVCGHLCRRKCHSDDKPHLESRCFERCRRTCAYGHVCQRKCYEECDSCDSIVWKRLACGHKALMKCSLETSNYLCEFTVKKRMEPCSHWVNLQCWMPPLSHKYCPHQCPTSLKCGHLCPLQCNSLKHPNHDQITCKCEKSLLTFVK